MLGALGRRSTVRDDLAVAIGENDIEINRVGFQDHAQSVRGELQGLRFALFERVDHRAIGGPPPTAAGFAAGFGIIGVIHQ